IWTYATPTVVLGCSQRALHAEVAARLPQGLELVQRPSGGGAVLTGPWLVGVSVVLPVDHPWVRGGLVDSYREFGLLHAAVLADLGIGARALPDTDVAQANAEMGATVDWACYGSLAPWELTDQRGRKLVGLAQRRQRNGILLVAGTLNTVPDWPLLCNALGHPEAASEMRRRTVACEELTQTPCSAETLAARLHQALAQALPDAEPTHRN
ncbi:MAG: lipoate--protein ligase family protein, partial [Giesbergeria sp.]